MRSDSKKCARLWVHFILLVCLSQKCLAQRYPFQMYGQAEGLTNLSATALAQRGIGKTGPNALHAGDNIKVMFLPAKDGSPLGFLKTVTMPDGHVIEIAAPNATE